MRPRPMRRDVRERMTARDTPEGVSWLRALGTIAAGSVGFAIGFYLGLFVILSIWGLDTGGAAFPVLTMAGGSAVAGLAMASTVTPMARRVRAFATAVVVGGCCLGVILLIDGDFESLWIAGIVVVLLTTALAHAWPLRPAS